MVRRILAIACLLSQLFAMECLGTSFDRLIVFGDSLSDVGNLDAATFGLQPGSDYFEGRFSNGPVYSEQLAEKLGLGPLRPSRDDGLNYAHGGARTSGTTFFEGGLFIQDFDEQLEVFFEDQQLSGGDLVVVFVGSNDFILGEAQNAEGRANRVVTQLERLVDSGAENLLSINLPLMGETPDGRSDRESLNARAEAFNTRLAQGVENLQERADVNLFSLDIAELLTILLEEPNAFGFENTTQRGQSAADDSGYLFWDGNHPTTAAHALFAEAAHRLVQPEADLVGDYTLDRVLDNQDLDLLGRQVAQGTARLQFDVDGDGTLSRGDVDGWLSIAGRVQADLDASGQVGFEDFLQLSGNFGRTDESVRWSTGDLDVDGAVAFADFLLLSNQFGQPSVAGVPEPSSKMMILALLPFCLELRRLRSSGRR